MIVELLTDYHLEFLSLKGGCRDSSKSIHVQMPHCWKSHATTQRHNGIQGRLYSCITCSRVLRSLLHLSEMALSYSCADPESFVRGGPTLTTFHFFSLMREEGSRYHYKRAINGPPAKHH